MTDKYITVYQKGDIHIVDMFQKNVLTTKKEIPVDKGFIDDICQEIKKITLLANRIPYEANPEEICSHLVLNLKNTGELLFKNLFPDDIQKNLRESEGTDMYLRLDEKVLHIPWELCYDGQEFLSLKYRIGRQVLTENKTLTSFKELKRDKLSMLIIIDPSETLRYAQKEAEILYSLLENQTQTDIDVELLGGRYANKFRILKEIADKDFVHFIGHSIYNENQIEKSGWVLKDGIITSDEISKMDNPPVVVFSNSCQSVATASHDGYLFDERSLGIGGGFMIAGTRNFIGPLWIIHDEKSVNFAVDFYTSFINGKPIGQALNDAKLKVINTDGLCNLLWASYVLYGDPSIHIKTKDSKQGNKDYNKNFYSHKASTSKNRRIKMTIKKFSSILLFIILISFFGFLSWMTWISKDGKTEILSVFNNIKEIFYPSKKSRLNNTMGKSSYPMRKIEKQSKQAAVSNQWLYGKSAPTFQNNFLKVGLQSISISDKGNRVNLAISLQNITNEDLFLSLKKGPGGIETSLIDDHGGLWKLLRWNGINSIYYAFDFQKNKKDNFTQFSPGSKNVIIMVFESRQETDATEFDFSADLYKYSKEGATQFSIGLSDMKITR